MIHIGNQLKLHQKIITKKAAGEINSTLLKTTIRSIYSSNKILLHLRKKLKMFLLIPNPF
jgi:hypothetical protein